MVCRAGKRSRGIGKATYYLVDSKLVQRDKVRNALFYSAPFFIKERAFYFSLNRTVFTGRK